MKQACRTPEELRAHGAFSRVGTESSCSETSRLQDWIHSYSTGTMASPAAEPSSSGRQGAYAQRFSFRRCVSSRTLSLDASSLTRVASYLISPKSFCPIRPCRITTRQGSFVSHDFYAANRVLLRSTFAMQRLDDIADRQCGSAQCTFPLCTEYGACGQVGSYLGAISTS